MSNKKNEYDERDKISITMRGIDDKAYRDISALAKKNNMAVGTMVNEALRDFLEMRERPDWYFVQNIGELTVSKADLKSAGKPFCFRKMNLLAFEEGITWDIFSRHVVAIHGIAKLYVPRSLSRLLVLSVCRNIGEIRPLSDRKHNEHIPSVGSR